MTHARTTAIHFIRTRPRSNTGAGRTQISAAFGLIKLVTAAAVLEYGGSELLECRLVRNSGLGGLHILGELGEAGVEVRLVLPDCRQRRRPAARLTVVGKESRRFRRPLV